MNKLILCTIGTSIANGCPSLQGQQGHLSRWEDEASELENEILDKISKLDYVRDQETRRALSAELNVLDRIGLGAGDRVVLIATDSAPGRICSQVLANIIEEMWGVDVDIRRIEGMQVYDSRRLRDTGIKNLVKTILNEYLANPNIMYAYDIILNPTGGYKAIVPFLTVLGMLYGRKAVYLFEHAKEMIELPPLPLTFDLHIYERVKDALKYIEEHGFITVQEYLSRITGYDPAERDLFLSFAEPVDDGRIGVSPLAYTLLKIEENGKAPMVSDKLRKMLEDLASQQRRELEKIISASANPLWREHKMHRWQNSNILIIKPGSSPLRLVGFMKEGVFHAAMAFVDHDKYKRELGGYTLDKLKSFSYSEWEGEIEEDSGQTTPDDEKIKLNEEILRLNATIDTLRSSLADLESRKESSDSEKERMTLAARLDSLETLSAEAQEKLDEAHAQSRELVEENRKKDQEIYRLGSTMDILQEKNTECEERLHGCGRQLEMARQELEAVAKERDSLSAQKESFELELSKLSAQVEEKNAVEKAAESLRSENHRLGETIRTLKESSKKHKEMLSFLQNSMDKKDEKLDLYAEKLRRMKKKLNSRDEKISRLEEILSSRKQKKKAKKSKSAKKSREHTGKKKKMPKEK